MAFIYSGAYMEYKIIAFHPGEEFLLNRFIKEVYDEFVAPDYSQKGNDFFYKYISPENILQRHISGEDKIYLARINNEWAGMIAMKNKTRLSLLFVIKKFMGQGIAKTLFQQSLQDIKNENTDSITVHASPFSIPVYDKLGFVATDAMQEENGIKYLPMEYRIGK
jgi:hypothetical protein